MTKSSAAHTAVVARFYSREESVELDVLSDIEEEEVLEGITVDFSRVGSSESK